LFIIIYAKPTTIRETISKWTFVIVLGVWLSLCLSAVATLIVLDLRDIKKDLIQYGDAYSDHLDKEMISSETILKGFSALFSGYWQHRA